MKLDWKALLGIAVTVALLWWVFQDVDFREVWAEVRQAHWGYLAGAVSVATAGFLVRALRWKVLLAPVRPDTTLRSRFAAVNIGFMVNNLLPARMGEFARAYALSRVEPVSVSAAFGSLVVERFLDGIVLMAFLLLAMAAPTFPVGASVREGPMGTALEGFLVVLIVGVGGLFALIRWPRPVIRLAERTAALLPGDFARPLVDALEAFLESLAILRRPRLLLLGFLWTVAFWTWHGLSFWLGMKAFAIELDFVAAIFVEAVVGFGVAIPSAPGFFGTFHAAADWALSDIYGVAPARSLAFAFGYHLGGFIPVTLIGLWYAWRIGLSLKEMERSEARVEEAVERAHPEAAAILGSKGASWRDPDPPAAREDTRVLPADHTAGVDLDAPAKVNLTLRVGPRRADGYHDVHTLLQAIDLADRVRVTRAEPGVALEIGGRAVPGAPSGNLAVRAARAFAEATGREPAWRIELDKRIPAGAGLGGGSSDAGATLRALNRLEGAPLDREGLLELARGLGADVAFFLGDATLASGRGRGDRLTPLSALPVAEMVLAIPRVHVSTEAAYRALDVHRESRAPAGPRQEVGRASPSDWDAVAAGAVNDFEAVVPSAHPPVAEALAALRASGARIALLSGSGGACFGVYTDAAGADAGAAAVRAAAPEVEVVRARTLDVWPDPRAVGEA